jgi:hypothetical protein
LPILADNKCLSSRIGILAPQTFFLTIIPSIFFIMSFYLNWLWHGWQNLWSKKKTSIVELNLSLNCQALVRVTHPPQFSPPWLSTVGIFHTKIRFCYDFILLRKLEIIQFPSNFDHQIPRESQRRPHRSLGFIPRLIFPFPRLLPSTPEFLPPALSPSPFPFHAHSYSPAKPTGVHSPVIPQYLLLQNGQGYLILPRVAIMSSKPKESENSQPSSSQEELNTFRTSLVFSDIEATGHNAYQDDLSEGYPDKR